MNNYPDNGFENNGGEQGAPTPQMKTHFDSSKLKKYLIPAVFFLIPAVLLTVYAILEGLDVLPPRIYLGGTRIRLVGLTDNSFMMLLTVLSFIICPIVAIAILAYRMRGSESFGEAEENGIDANTCVQRFIENKEESSVTEETVSFDGGNEVITAEESEQAAEPTEAASLPEEPIEEVIPPRPEYVRYSKLSEIDRTAPACVSKSFTESFTLEMLLEDFIAFLCSKGYDMPPETARRLLSAVGASRCLWITGKKKNVTSEIVKLLAEYFGSSVHEEKLADTEYSTSDLSVRYEGNGAFSESGFIVDVYGANYAQDKISFAALSGNFSKVSLDCLAPYISGADVAGRVRKVEVISEFSTYGTVLNHIIGNKMSVPSNIWYLLLSDDAACAAMPNGAVAVDLGAVAVKEPSEMPEKEWILSSMFAFSELIRHAKDEKYISEEYWKKLDATEEYVSAKLSGFALDNKKIRSIERYAAVCLSMNGSLYEALDGVVAGMLIPALSSCDKEALNGSEDGIAAFIDKTFGMDNMPFTHEILRKLDLN